MPGVLESHSTHGAWENPEFIKTKSLGAEGMSWAALAGIPCRMRTLPISVFRQTFQEPLQKDVFDGIWANEINFKRPFSQYLPRVVASKGRSKTATWYFKWPCGPSRGRVETLVQTNTNRSRLWLWASPYEASTKSDFEVRGRTHPSIFARHLQN